MTNEKLKRDIKFEIVPHTSGLIDIDKCIDRVFSTILNELVSRIEGADNLSSDPFLSKPSKEEFIKLLKG